MDKCGIIPGRRELLIILLLATLMTVVLCPPCLHNWAYAWRFWGITVTIWLVMWYGNGFVAGWLDRWIAWKEQPGKRLLLGIVSSVAYSALAMLLLAWLFNRVLDIDIGNVWQLVLISVVISIIILLFIQARQFIFSWRDLALREERLRGELMASRYEVLKNQLNPHFLFNSLNALADLVHEDPALAEKYINQLSRVLRYVLETSQQAVVPLATELDILQAYVFLQQIRFGANFKVDIDVPEAALQKRVPPLVLQLLLENAIKHNEITAANPLRVKITLEQDNLQICNNLQPRESLKGESTGTGLANVQARYNALTDRQVRVSRSDGQFCVVLPLLDKQS